MPSKTLLDFFEKSPTIDLKLYKVKFIVHGYLWFHTTATPTNLGWVHQVAPVIHNYSLALGLLGYLVEEAYANKLGEPTYTRTRDLIRAENLYVYPAIVKKSISRKVQFTGIGDGYASIRGKTRLSYPERGFNTILFPGSELISFILTKKDNKSLPRFIRIGSKRFGILKAEYKRVKYRFVSHREITHPANTHDSGTLATGLLLLKHPGGDIVAMGKASRALEVEWIEKGKIERTILAYPSRILGDTI